jgi:hypothetical protein
MGNEECGFDGCIWRLNEVTQVRSLMIDRHNNNSRRARPGCGAVVRLSLSQPRAAQLRSHSRLGSNNDSASYIHMSASLHVLNMWVGGYISAFIDVHDKSWRILYIT